ncbi:unnamed protein product [Acanthosepion pharaonis]|uniref:Uncharacterized protein n=1 Tax=Acanthosepion pharaonis TaxID=158019 RepID=A0A812DHL4_ACAPH|nr:unnamed protein product [Sepia pharaonis]
MTVVAGDDTYMPEDDGQPVPLIQAELNDNTRPGPFKGVCSAAGFTSQRETYSYPLVEPNETPLPSLHIKLGLMKNVGKAIEREGSWVAFPQEEVIRISKASILDGSQIREPMKDLILDEAELSAWQSLMSVVTNFLGNLQSAEYVKEIEELVKIFRQLGARICGGGVRVDISLSWNCIFISFHLPSSWSAFIVFLSSKINFFFFFQISALNYIFGFVFSTSVLFHYFLCRFFFHFIFASNVFSFFLSFFLSFFISFFLSFLSRSIE